MKKIRHTLFFLALIGASSALGAPQTWTNKEGQTMEAELVHVQGEQVTFRRDGRTYTFGIENLAQGDQERVRRWERETAASRTPAASAAQGRPASSANAVSTALNGKLVRVQGGRLREISAGEAENPQLIAFYYSALWCPPCRAFTPDLVKFYNQAKRQHPDFEIVFVSSDRDLQSMEKYMKDYKMPFPAVQYEARGNIDVVRRNAPRGIPHLVMVDGNGQVVAGGNGGARASLQQIQNYLASRS